MADDFKIAKDGTVVRGEQTNIEIAENEEMLSLEEDVFRHPELYSEQELRKNEAIDKKLKELDTEQFNNGSDKLKAMMDHQNKEMTIEQMMQLMKQKQAA